jgi:hypothetical protein
LAWTAARRRSSDWTGPGSVDDVSAGPEVLEVLDMLEVGMVTGAM